MRGNLRRAVGLAAPVLAALAFTCEQRDPDPTLLMPASGRLVVAAVTGGGSDVGARVLVDGAPEGRTPLTLTLAPGTYAVAVDTSGFVAAPADTLVEVTTGATAEATFSLERGFPRRVVVEEFTNSGCQGCPEFEALLGTITGDLGDERVTVLAVHTNIPDNGDPMLGANALELLQRSVIYYGIGGNPSAAIDGTLLPGVPPSEQMVRDSVVAHRREASPVDLEMSYDVAGDEVVAEITVRAVDDVPGDHRLVLMTVQSEIGYDAPPGANGQMLFRHVVRDLAPSHEGDPIPITAGMETTRTITAQLFTTALPPDDVDRLECVAVLQEWSTKKILQVVHGTSAGRPGAAKGVGKR